MKMEFTTEFTKTQKQKVILNNSDEDTYRTWTMCMEVKNRERKMMIQESITAITKMTDKGLNR